MIKTFLAFILLLTMPLLGQDVREISTPVDHVTLTDATVATITAKTSSGYRITDLEYRGGNFDAVLVRNTGSYAAGWWWYYGLTSTQLSSYLTANQARLLDLEAYDTTSGVRYACVMVDNTGSNAKAWWYYLGTTTANLSTQLSAHSARLVDLDSYTVSGTTYYSGVMIANTGADARSWWWYLNQTTTQVSNLLTTNQAQLYDLERLSNGNFDVVMIRDPSPQAWYWWAGVSTSELSLLAGNYGLRIIDVESYSTFLGTRHAFVAIDNVNALSRSISDMMRADTDGSVGAWMQRVNGSNVVDLNSTRVFEPASTMKTLHHVHAMRRVYLGATALTQPITVYANYDPSNTSCPIDSGPFGESLQTSLRFMMENSDNARTQAVRNYFGEANLNATAAALAMVDTQSRHRLGCGVDALANPNQITLRDLHALHEAVANGYLGSYRETFYDLMLDCISCGSDLTVGSIINSEGAALGLPASAINSFLSMTRLAHKGGSYDLPISGVTYVHRAEFGYIGLPVISGNQVLTREYTFGAFVNNATNGTGADTAIWTHALPEMLRPTIRSALQTWAGHTASIGYLGTGCGAPSAHQQVVSGIPRFNTTLNYVFANGFASALEVMVYGFSTTTANGIALPAPLAAYGSAAGCQAYTDIVANRIAIANAFGVSTFTATIPNSTGLLGVSYVTQGYSFHPLGTFLTSNAARTTIGF